MTRLKEAYKFKRNIACFVGNKEIITYRFFEDIIDCTSGIHSAYITA